MRVRAVSEREQATEELEERLLEWEQLDNINLGWELEGLKAHEHTLEMEDQALEDTCLTVAACELAAHVREINLDTRAAELADRER
jgi:hypothetical protein